MWILATRDNQFLRKDGSLTVYAKFAHRFETYSEAQMAIKQDFREFKPVFVGEGFLKYQYEPLSQHYTFLKSAWLPSEEKK
jgi:hypothetical protein